MLALVVAAAVVFVAATNGANANFKGVASLYGSGTLSLRAARALGTATTFGGALAAALLARGLLATFSGRGIVDDGVAATPMFAAAVAIGAAGTSLLATLRGFPVSTTHALVGALVGAGLSGGSAVHWPALRTTVVVPLLASPILAGVVAASLLRVLDAAGLASIPRMPALDAAHVASAAAASFARGLNDAPKMAALLLALPGADATLAIMTVALAMACGGIAGGRRVAETLGRRITSLTPGQGLAVSLSTAGLVTTASFHGLPVSTTHTSVGALVGVGTSTRQAHWRAIAEIAAAWVITVPCGAALAAAAAWVLGRLAG